MLVSYPGDALFIYARFRSFLRHVSGRPGIKLKGKGQPRVSYLRIMRILLGYSFLEAKALHKWKILCFPKVLTRIWGKIAHSGTFIKKKKRNLSVLGAYESEILILFMQRNFLCFLCVSKFLMNAGLIKGLLFKFGESKLI